MALAPTEGPGSQPSSSSAPPAATFSKLGLDPFLVRALTAMSITSPTEIQRACIPPILTGRDCIGGAKTGSGKTIAFAAPILQELARDPYGVFAVVLTPTRELAFQISEQFQALGHSINLSSSVVVGGLDMMSQAAELRQRPHVIIATPGRLADHLRNSGRNGEWDLKKCRFLVLDEADRLLTPTFAPELACIFENMAPQRQTLLFTATVTEAIMALQNRAPPNGKQRPFMHKVESDHLTVSTLHQRYVFLPSHVREPYLYYLLLHPPDSVQRRKVPAPSEAAVARNAHKDKGKGKGKRGDGGKGKEKAVVANVEPAEEVPTTIIFTSRCRTAALLSLMLQSLAVPCAPLHSRLSQSARLASLDEFRAHRVPVLVATDVGSRGLDIPEVEMVINYDLPGAWEDYVHRVGRTARAGRKGTSVSFVTERDTELVGVIEERVGARMEELELPEEQVLEKLNAVATAKRVASMTLHDEKWGEREETNKLKRERAMGVSSKAAKGAKWSSTKEARTKKTEKEKKR